MKDIETKRPRRLDLDAPLLSTRRSNIPPIDLSRAGSLRSSSSDRVPFSWEHSPGKPKQAFRTTVELNKVLPLPKPPQHDHHQHAIITDASFSDLFSLQQESFDSDENDDDDGYTSNEQPWSPNFMIQRFLPAATALAASSLSAIAASTNNTADGNDDDDDDDVCSASNNFSQGSHLHARVIAGDAYSSSRGGCGFQIFFPWRTKHRLCGVKSPVRTRVRSTLKPQLTSRN